MFYSAKNMLKCFSTKRYAIAHMESEVKVFMFNKMNFAKHLADLCFLIINNENN